jgi:hypothetical protein
MNKDFLEFWGNFLLQAARGQRQIEDVARWSRLGFEAVEEQRAFWNSFRPAENVSEKKPEALEIWEKTADEFRRSYREFVRLFGMVSMDEYQSLLKENKALEKKLAERKELSPKVRSAGKKVLDVQREIEKGLQELIQKQGDQYRELMESITTLYGQSLPDK